MTGSEPRRHDEPLIVRTHVAPWGFVLALGLGLVFAGVGVVALESGAAPASVQSLAETPLWALGIVLLVASLVLFLNGVAELASWLLPSIELIVDAEGLTMSGVLGKRRVTWGEIRAITASRDEIAIEIAGHGVRHRRTLRLPLRRLAVEPEKLVSRLRQQTSHLNHATARP
jgi:hypothetical protein